MRRVLSASLLILSLVGFVPSLFAEEATDANGQTFDMTGPGSEPLHQATEDRLQRYLNNDKCPLTYDTAIRDRCDFLLRLMRYQQKQAVQGDRLRRRSRVGDRVTTGRRGLDTAYSRSLTTATRVLQQQGGRMLRPRTILDLSDVGQQAIKTVREKRREQREAERAANPLEEEIAE